jgi:hypothetical protein
MSGMKDLLGDEPFCPRSPKQLGLELGHAAAERAADHAGDDWKDRAYAAFVSFSRSHKQFTTEDVRDASNVGEPPDLRAWGSVALRAKRKGIVRAAGWVSAKALNVHGNAVTLWETL